MEGTGATESTEGLEGTEGLKEGTEGLESTEGLKEREEGLKDGEEGGGRDQSASGVMDGRRRTGMRNDGDESTSASDAVRHADGTKGEDAPLSASSRVMRCSGNLERVHRGQPGRHGKTRPPIAAESTETE